METKIRKIQTAIFTKSFNVIDDAGRAQLLLDIDKHSGVIFDAPPVQVPIPNDAPPEFPRIILNSIDTRFNSNITLSRTDIFFSIPGDNKLILSDLLQTQKSNSENIFNFLIGRGIIINRIGFIVITEKILSPEEGDRYVYLRNNFIKEGRFNNPKELMFRYNSAGRSMNFDMNNSIIISGKLDNKIILQTDINTVAELIGSINFSILNFVEVIDYSINQSINYINNFPNI